MKIFIAIIVLFFVVAFGLPRFFRSALRRREARAQRILHALELVEQAGMSARSEKEEQKKQRELDQAIADLQKEGYNIEPK